MSCTGVFVCMCVYASLSLSLCLGLCLLVCVSRSLSKSTSMSMSVYRLTPSPMYARAHVRACTNATTRVLSRRYSQAKQALCRTGGDFPFLSVAEEVCLYIEVWGLLPRCIPCARRPTNRARPVCVRT